MDNWYINSFLGCIVLPYFIVHYIAGYCYCLFYSEPAWHWLTDIPFMVCRQNFRNVTKFSPLHLWTPALVFKTQTIQSAHALANRANQPSARQGWLFYPWDFGGGVHIPGALRRAGRWWGGQGGKGREVVSVSCKNQKQAGAPCPLQPLSWPPAATLPLTRSSPCFSSAIEVSVEKIFLPSPVLPSLSLTHMLSDYCFSPNF